MALVGIPKANELYQGFDEDLINKLLNAPIDRQYKQAQTQKESAEAAKSQMLMNLLGQATGYKSPDQQIHSSSDINQPNKMGFSARELIRAMMNLPPETPQEQSQRKIGEYESEHKLGKNIEEAKTIEDSSKNLFNLKSSLLRAKEILKRRPDLTGPIIGKAAKFGISSDPDLNALVDIFGDIQTDKTRLLGERGGAQAAKIVQGFKADVTRLGEANLAMIESSLESINDQISKNSSRYRKKTGESLEEIFGEEGKKEEKEEKYENKKSPKVDDKGFIILYKNNKEYHIPPKLMREALSSGGFTLGD